VTAGRCVGLRIRTYSTVLREQHGMVPGRRLLAALPAKHEEAGSWQGSLPVAAKPRNPSVKMDKPFGKYPGMRKRTQAVFTGFVQILYLVCKGPYCKTSRSQNNKIKNPAAFPSSGQVHVEKKFFYPRKLPSTS